MSDETVIDGGIVALYETGRPSFNLLQNHGSKATALVFYAFDVMILTGCYVMAEPFSTRRDLLQKQVLSRLASYAGSSQSRTPHRPACAPGSFIWRFGHSERPTASSVPLRSASGQLHSWCRLGLLGVVADFALGFRDAFGLQPYSLRWFPGAPISNKCGLERSWVDLAGSHGNQCRTACWRSPHVESECPLQEGRHPICLPFPFALACRDPTLSSPSDGSIIRLATPAPRPVVVSAVRWSVLGTAQKLGQGTPRFLTKVYRAEVELGGSAPVRPRSGDGRLRIR